MAGSVVAVAAALVAAAPVAAAWPAAVAAEGLPVAVAVALLVAVAVLLVLDRPGVVGVARAADSDLDSAAGGVVVPGRAVAEMSILALPLVPVPFV